MKSSTTSIAGNSIFEIKTTKIEAAISLVPLLGFVWSILRQQDLNSAINKVSSTERMYALILEKNKVKKLTAIGCLVQSIIYVSYRILARASMSAALTDNPWAILAIFNSCIAAMFYIQAKLNERKFTSANDMSNGDSFY